MDVLFNYLCTIWMIVGCLFGLIVIAAFVKMFVNLIRME